MLSELSKYRLALAVCLETADYLPVLERSDLDQLKEIVADLVMAMDLETLLQWCK